MIRLDHAAATLHATPQEIAAARDTWRRAHHLAIPDILAPDLFATVARAIERTSFGKRVHQGIGTELCAEAGGALALLQFVANDGRLFQIVRELTGHDGAPFRSFEGRVYRFVPGTAHRDSWHSDAVRTRAIALSVNLGAEPYQGGVLQIRERGSERVLAEVENTRPGGAVLFRIASHLEHRITTVTGTVPKTAYAGWFREEPDFREVVAGRATFD